MNINGQAATKIAEITANHAEECKTGPAATSAVIECIVGAAAPMIGNMFTGGTLQERLLFALVLTGACATLNKSGRDECSVSISITPETLREAFDIFTRLTDKDIQHHLPKAIVAFAAERSLH